MPDEVREHLTRDQRPFLHPESLQILQIPSSMTVLSLFGSPHSFSIGCRSGNWNGHSRSLVLCPVTHFCVVFKVCFWIIVRLEDTNMAHYKISNSQVTFRFFICWYLIESVMPCGLKQDVQDLEQKYRPTTLKLQQYISLYTRVLFNPCVHQTHLECLLLKSKFFLVTSDHRSQSHLKFQSCLTTEYAGDCFLVKAFSFLEALPNNMWWCRCCLIFFLRFSDPETQPFFCNSPAVILEESLATQTLLLTLH